MAAEKKFLDVFLRYKPSDEKMALLDRAHSAKFRYSKDPMRVEVELSFDTHESAELIYEIEDECRELYGAESFKILPHFNPNVYSAARMNEIAAEAALCGAVTNGFFTSAEYSDDGENITVRLPFSEYGIDFVKNADTERILSNILFSRYGVKRGFIIVSGANAEEYAAKWQKRREQLLIDAVRESR